MKTPGLNRCTEWTVANIQERYNTNSILKLVEKIEEENTSQLSLRG